MAECFLALSVSVWRGCAARPKYYTAEKTTTHTASVRVDMLHNDRSASMLVQVY